ncbi:MAG TPA: VOC family protein [Opitutaceae bacterium]|nr:VOC family protein [Opitutaceae bacterium]
MAARFGITLSHFGIFVTDIAKMVDFYTRFLGFIVSDRGDRDNGGAIVFMTRDPAEHHQLVMATGKPANMPFNPVNQISLRVDSLATLRKMHEGLKKEPVKILGPVSHGNALSVYFLDPEGNRVELLIDTPWYVPQPFRVEVDLGLPDDKLWAHLERIARDTPGFKPRAEWQRDVEQKLAAADARRG